MKKRSLLAAVVMLVVSAIVLTSATYAWFAQAGTATVASVSASITNNTGGILVSADQQTWGLSVTEAQYKAVGTNIFPYTMDGETRINDTFTPVSGSLTTPGQVDYVGGSLSGTTFTASQSNGHEYMYYNTYVKAQAPGTVTVTPNFTTNSGFIYYYMYAKKSDGTAISGGTFTLAQAADGYTPVASSSGTATDSNGNAIIDTGESGVTLGSPVTAAGTASQNFTYHMTTDEVITITIYMWAEGNDANCKGSVSSHSGTSALALSYTLDSNNP